MVKGVSVDKTIFRGNPIWLFPEIAITINKEPIQYYKTRIKQTLSKLFQWDGWPWKSLYTKTDS